MERLPQELGEEVAARLVENDVTTIETFMMLSQEMVMSNLQMKLGSWLRIQKLQQTFHESEIKSETIQTSLNNSNPIQLDENINKDSVINVLESSPQCQKLLRGKLAEGVSLLKKEKLLINRTLCDHFFLKEVNAGRSITTAVKKKLAQSIIEAFDCLTCNAEDKPVEADFFWEHNGEASGEHTGYIHFWIRNKQAQAPSSVKRKRNNVQNLTRENADTIDELLELDENTEYSIVEQLMRATFQYRDGLRKRSIRYAEMLDQFPHLLLHDGQSVHCDFELMYPDKDATQPFSTIVPLCLMLNHFYDEIACVGIQALLKIMAVLTHQGNVRKADPTNLPPLEDFASVFVRWKQEAPNDEIDTSCAPFIYCDTLAFAEGMYYVILDRSTIACGPDFFQALDLLLKIYKVLNVKVPSRAKKTLDFFDVFVYKILKYSRVTRVNDLCAHLSKAVKTLPQA
ncbi:uncharacterized protein LOC135706264 [Ochlerotatus camptorhynchus]|uniref:uncharacterized protein LOC135706264 n=1 Tax=Ochlerotatus camptorhynchus TaxID=644619 RepID=UPI0031D73EFC